MQSASCYTKPTLCKIRATTGVVAHIRTLWASLSDSVFFQKTGYKKQRTSTFPRSSPIPCPFIVFILQSGDSKLWPSKHVDMTNFFILSWALNDCFFVYAPGSFTGHWKPLTFAHAAPDELATSVLFWKGAAMPS